MFLDPINEIIEGLRQRWVRRVTALAYLIRRIMHWYLLTEPGEVRPAVPITLDDRRENPPLGATELSFYDDFHVISGVPVFVLDPDKAEGIEHLGSSLTTSSKTETVTKITFYENKNAITCCAFSADGSRVVSGHDNGSLIVWSADHGTMLHEHKKIHRLSPVANVAFHAGSTTIVVSCDFHGNFAMWDTSTRVMYGDCSANWKQEEMLGPKVRWPMFCTDGTSLMYPVTYFSDIAETLSAPDEDFDLDVPLMNESLRGAPTGLHFRQGCSLFVFDTTPSGPEKGHHTMVASRVLHVTSRNNAPDFAFAWGAFSNSTMGLLVGFNERPSGFVAVFPDFGAAPDVGFLLKGIVGCWSPLDDYIATWDIYTKESANRRGVCNLWRIGAFDQSSPCPMPEVSGTHLSQASDPTVLKDPDGGKVYWAAFLPDLHGALGVATCVIKDQLDILLWEVESKTLLQRLCTEISRTETRLVDTDAWDNQWVRVQRSYGLRLIATSGNSLWMGLYSADAGKGYLWDARTGIQVLSFGVPGELSKNPNGVSLDMDLHFSHAGDRFLLCNEETMLVWNPRPLGRSMASQLKQGISTAVLHSSDKLINNGRVSCQFSKDGEMLGICRSYALVMSVWDLGTGQKYTLLPGAAGDSSPKEIEALLAAKKAQRTRRVLNRNLLYSDPSVTEYVPFVSEKFSDEDTLSNRNRFCVFGISPHGKRVVTCMGDLSVLIWELKGSSGHVVTSSRKIAKLWSRYYPAWAITFSSDPEGLEMVVVCEDTGVLVWIDPETQSIVSRRHGGGLKRCRFSSDGARGVLMPNDHEVYVWDLINRRRIQKLDYNLWLGRSGVVPFPHNVSLLGNLAVVGVRSDWELSNQGEGFLTCSPDTTEADLKDLDRVPANLMMSENSGWVVVDKLVETSKGGLRTQPMATPQAAPKMAGGMVDLFRVLPHWDGQPNHDLDNPPVVTNMPEFKVNPYPSLPLQVTTIEEGQESQELLEEEEEGGAQASHQEPQFMTDRGEAPGGNVSRFPAVEEYYSDDTWEYLLERAQGQDIPTDRLMVLDINGLSKPKILKGRGLQPSKFIAMSPNGRRVACLGEEGGLYVWNVHATDGCLKDWHDLELSGAIDDEQEVVQQLDAYGPGLLNYPDHEGWTVPMHAILAKNHELLGWLTSWAMQHHVPMDLIKESGYGYEGGITTALDLTMLKQTSECAEIILKHLSQGLTSQPAMMRVYSASLIPLSKVFPSAYCTVLSNNTLFHTLPTIKVPEWTFWHRDFKLTTKNTMLYTRSGLQRMWLDHLKASHRLDVRLIDSTTDATKMISAVPRVVPYPGIVSLDKGGFMKQLSIRHGGSQIYSTLIVKAVIHAHWKVYGQQLVVEELWHFALLWLLFTTYSITLGGLWNLISFDQFFDPNAPRRQTNMYAAIALMMCWILGLVGLIREFTKVNALCLEYGARGLLRWARSHWNLVDLFSYALLVGVITPYHFFVAAGSTEIAEQNHLTVMVSTESILLSWKMLRYAQGFRTTAPVVIMIKEIVKSIIFFLILTFGLMVGFAIAFFVLFRVNLNRPCFRETTELQSQNRTDLVGSANETIGNITEAIEVTTRVRLEQCEVSKQEAQSLYGNVWLSMLTAFGMMLGETQLESLDALDGSLRVIGTIMFVIYLLAIMIVLLNLLIAVMGDSFDKVKNTEEDQFLLARSEVINDMESMMSKKKREACSASIGKYLHILEPQKEESKKRQGEWRGRMLEQQCVLRKEMKNLYGGLKTNVDERFDALVDILKANGMDVPEAEQLPGSMQGSLQEDENEGEVGTIV